MNVKKFQKEDYLVVAGRKVVKKSSPSIITAAQRPQIGNSQSEFKSLDTLPFIDRSLIDYERYHQFVGHAGRKNHMALQATRGCPYKCFYCDIPGHEKIDCTWKKQGVPKEYIKDVKNKTMTKEQAIKKGKDREKNNNKKKVDAKMAVDKPIEM